MVASYQLTRVKKFLKELVKLKKTCDKAEENLHV